MSRKVSVAMFEPKVFSDRSKEDACEFIEDLPKGAFLAITSETNVVSGMSFQTTIFVWYYEG